MSSKNKIPHVLDTLKARYGLWRARRDPFRVLVATVISQRCRDEVTDEVAAELFKHFSTPEEFAGAPKVKLEKLLHRSGFYRQKAERIKAIARILVGEHESRVPADREQLLQLPGVGRKTANCVLNFGFGAPAIAVDTHVHRISNRLGWVKTKTPEQTEGELERIVPPDRWVEVNGLFVDFGRDLCRPINPRCQECTFSTFCPTGKSRVKALKAKD
ncbi:MAG: endonuclease III [bacterium]